MRLLIATTFTPFVRGGAEILAEDLQRALVGRGHEAELLQLPWEWSRAEAVLDQIAGLRLLDVTTSAAGPIDRLIALKCPAWYLRHPNKVLWIVHQQRQAYELWADSDGLARVPAGDQIRDLLHAADRLACAEARSIFTIAGTVSERLERDLGIASTPLLIPPRHGQRLAALPPNAESEDDVPFLFFPSRLAPLKRQRLVVDALAHTEPTVRVHFAGFDPATDAANELLDQARRYGVDDRVACLGHLDDEALIDAYARSRAVVFPPFDEDYGYVTAEAMHAAKPVITCRDAGGPLELVVDGETGWITEPDAVALATAFDDALAEPEAARSRGLAGRTRIDALGLSWDHIVERLTA